MNGQTNDTQWYIARDGKQHGPLTDIEMRTFVAHNYLRSSDLIWRPGMAEWQLAPTLFPAVFPTAASSASAASSTGSAAGGSAAATTPSSPIAERTSAASAPQAMSGGINSGFATTASGMPGGMTQSGRANPGEPHHRQPLEPVGERSMAKRLAVAAVAITIIGGGAFALANYREPLMQLVTGSTDGTSPATDATPTIEAPAASVAGTSPPDAATPETTSQAAAQAPVETATVTVPDSTVQSSTPPTDTAAASQATSAPSTDGATPDPATQQTQVAAVAPDTATSPNVIVSTAGVEPPSLNGSTIDARLQKIPAWATIKKDYPDWYVTNIAAAEQLVTEQKPATEVSTHIAQSLVALRRQNADKALAASTDKLRRIAVAFLENLKSLRSQSVTACYGFISKGETSPSVVQLVDTPDGPTAFHSQISAIFDAIAEGTKSPQQHPPAVKADYDLLIKELSKLGWKEEDLQVFSNPRLLAKREPERVCTMVQEWFVAHLAVPDKNARDRLLFETLKPVISG